MNYRYLIRDSFHTIPVLLQRGDIVNLREVFKIKTDRKSYKIESAIWRCDEDGLYAEIYFMDFAV